MNWKEDLKWLGLIIIAGIISEAIVEYGIIPYLRARTAPPQEQNQVKLI